MTLFWILLVGLSVAQDANPERAPEEPSPPAEETTAPRRDRSPDPQPLAVPVTPASAPTPGAPLDEDTFRALRDYQGRRLVVRDEVEMVGGGYTVMGGWARPIGPYGWIEPSVVVPQPARINHGWALYQGRDRLDLLTFLDLTGEHQRKAAAETALKRYRRRGTLWFSVAGVGLAGVLGGMIALDQARTPGEARVANQVLLGGSLSSVAGLVVGSIPRGKADRLQRLPALSLRYQEARTLADRHNDSLRETLGLTPAEVWTVEQQDP